MEFAPKLKKWIKRVIPSQVYWLPRYYLLFKRYKTNRNQLILDAGCGEGIVAKKLILKKMKVFGIDRSFSGVKTTSESCRQNTFTVADVKQLPFKNESFDLVYSLDVLGIVKDINDVFQEFSRILKTNGKLIISIPFGYTCIGELFSLQKILRRITPVIFWTRSFPHKRSWLDYTEKEISEHLHIVKTYTLDELTEVSKKYFHVSYSEYAIKMFGSLAFDMVYGIKGFRYLKFPLLFIATRMDHYFFKKMPGYLLFVELTKK